MHEQPNIKLDSEKRILPPSRGKRFLNYAIDSLITSGLVLIIVMVVGFIIGFIFHDSASDGRLVAIVYGLNFVLQVTVFFFYYAFCEYFFGRTPGKYLTKTKVVRFDGSPLNFAQTIGRTLLRMIPVDFLSYLTKNPVGWHDSFSKTVVVSDSYTAEDVLSMNLRAIHSPRAGHWIVLILIVLLTVLFTLKIIFFS